MVSLAAVLLTSVALVPSPLVRPLSAGVEQNRVAPIVCAEANRRGHNRNREASRRQGRVAQVVQAELSQVIRSGSVRGSKQIDGRLRGMIQIIDVDVSPDLAQAGIKVSVIGDRKDKISAIRWLQGNSRSIRHVMAQQMKQMKRVPQLRFSHVDVGKAVDVMVTLERLASERKAKEAKQGYRELGDDEIDFEASDDEAFADDGFWEEDEEGTKEEDLFEADDESAWDLLEEEEKEDSWEEDEQWGEPAESVSGLQLQRAGAVIRVFREKAPK